MLHQLSYHGRAKRWNLLSRRAGRPTLVPHLTVSSHPLRSCKGSEGRKSRRQVAKLIAPVQEISQQEGRFARVSVKGIPGCQRALQQHGCSVLWLAVGGRPAPSQRLRFGVVQKAMGHAQSGVTRARLPTTFEDTGRGQIAGQRAVHATTTAHPAYGPNLEASESAPRYWRPCASAEPFKGGPGAPTMAARGAFNSRIGFVMAAVGSAVGLGNLWRFPYLASTNGGASFLILYLGMLFIIGIPALMAELSLGRQTRRNAVDAYGEDGKRKAWAGAGILAALTAMLLLSYYSVIAGWSVRYMLDAFFAPYFDDAGGYFADISEGPQAVLFHFLFMAATLAIVTRGVSKGIEKANLIMMPILFATVIGLVIYANVQDGSGAGRSFYLEPDFGAITGGTVSAAAGQAFFSIGLGIGTMLTYSSYLSRDGDLQGTGLTIGLADTAVAVLAGFMVFPLIFSLGLDHLIGDAGSSSVGGLFIALPTAFADVGGTLGGILAGGFFLMLTFAALSSAISLLEVPVSVLADRKPDWGRGRAVLLVGIIVYLVGLFSAIDLDFLGYADILVSRVLLITGGLLLSIYVGWVRPEILDELLVGGGHERGAAILRPTIRYVLPVLLGALTALGILGFLVDVGWMTPAEGSSLADFVEKFVA